MSDWKYLYDRKIPGLILHPENRHKEAHDKIIRLDVEPYIGTIHNGQRAGEYCCVVRTTFSPLPGQNALDSVDNVLMTIREIADWCNNKIPNIVLLTGGEPFFRYHEELEGLRPLLRAETDLIVNTPGIHLPRTIDRISSIGSIPDLIRIHIDLCDGIVPENENFHYRKTLIRNLSKFLHSTNTEIVFQPRYGKKEMIDDIHQAFNFLIDVEEESTGLLHNAKIIFSVFEDDNDAAREEVGKRLINLRYARISVEIDQN